MFHFTDNSRHLCWTCLDSLSGFSYKLFYSIRSYKFYLSILLLVEVSLVKMPPKRTIELFYGFIKAKLSTY